MAYTGPPVRIEGRRRNPALPTDIQGEPVVSDLERAGQLLGCDPGQLAQAVQSAGLQVWAKHADGSDCYRWPELLEAARELGIRTPASRPTLASARARRQAKRERKLAGSRKQP